MKDQYKYSLKILIFFLLISNFKYPQWTVQYSQSYNLLDYIHMVDYNNGWAVGGRLLVGALILKTTNGGTDWYGNLIIPNSPFTFTSIYFVNANKGWVVGYGGIIMRTSNTGISWDTVTIPTSGALKQIQFLNSDYGWVVGTEEVGVDFRGIILRTTVGGINWERIDLGEGNNFNACYFVNENLGWGVGTGIQKTTDGAITWNTQKDTTGHSIYFTDEFNRWCVGAEEAGPFGFIFNTTNGGNSWIRYLGSYIPSLKSVDFFNKDIGWAVGNQSSSPIIKTTDGGDSWFQQESGTVNSLRSVYIIDSLTGWTVGGDLIGYILKTTNGGVTFVEEEVNNGTPTNYYLSNNFPNPFNPTTKIKYSIPQSSNVVIKVFDILGSEIETLVNEEKQTGTYEVEFNSHSGEVRNLPSGVYFYQLKVADPESSLPTGQAGSGQGFVETNKMLLLK